MAFDDGIGKLVALRVVTGEVLGLIGAVGVHGHGDSLDVLLPAVDNGELHALGAEAFMTLVALPVDCAGYVHVVGADPCVGHKEVDIVLCLRSLGDRDYKAVGVINTNGINVFVPAAIGTRKTISVGIVKHYSVAKYISVLNELFLRDQFVIAENIREDISGNSVGRHPICISPCLIDMEMQIAALYIVIDGKVKEEVAPPRTGISIRLVN